MCTLDQAKVEIVCQADIKGNLWRANLMLILFKLMIQNVVYNCYNHM